MDLVTRFLAARRDKLLMKLGCWLVCFSLVLGLMLPQQRAEALVAELTIGSVAALAASYLCACGLPLVTQGMNRDALVSNVQRLIQEFLDTELGGITIQDWLGNVWDLAVIAGKLIMGRPLTDEFVSFAQWVAGKYGAQVGENTIYWDYYLYFSNGEILTNHTNFYRDTVYHLTNGHTIQFLTSLHDDGVLLCDWLIDGQKVTSASVVDHYHIYRPKIYNLEPIDIRWSYTLQGFDETGNSVFSKVTPTFYLGKYFGDSSCLSIDRAPSMSYIPEGIKEGEGIALDVGAAATMDLDLVLQGVLDDVIAGELTSTMEAAGEAVVDPPAEEIPDVDNLGLPALGAALTSRFPFSIPWDFFRAVQLLAAPAKAPYFEVDFMEPLADDVGGWQGDTTVILDFSEYAIIGQISRWTSTIGFCLMLAGATKRLIWTA